jgi:hypothetical protein
MPRDHQKIVLQWLKPAYLAERNVKAGGADACSLVEDGLQVALTEGKGAKIRERFCTPLQLSDLQVKALVVITEYTASVRKLFIASTLCSRHSERTGIYQSPHTLVSGDVRR